MDFSNLYETQRLLDERICRKKKIRAKDTISAKFLALKVELAELAQITRVFKYWSEKPAYPPAAQLEEYVDCLHFALSLGLDLEYNHAKIPLPKEHVGRVSKKEVINLFNTVLDTLSSEFETEEGYKRWFINFLKLGFALDFTLSEIEVAYYQKNEINHERQDNGY